MWEAIVKVMGGRAVFGNVPGRIDLIKEIDRGLPTAAYETLAKALHLKPEEANAVLRVSPRTRSRWKQRQRLDADSSDKLARVARIYALAIDVLENPQHAVAWLREPSASLHGVRPLDALATDAGTEQVVNILHQMEYGVYA